MIIILLGPPGSGKGTQANFIQSKLSIPHLSTGDILRQSVKNETDLGYKVKNIMAKGELVSDDLVLDVIKERVSQSDCDQGFILDGYPRNITQAESLDSLFTEKNIKLEYVFLIDVPFETLIERCTGRLLCTTCDYIGNMDRGEKVGDKCEEGELYQREDDKEETVKNRLNVYQEQTAPIIDFYQKKGILHKMIGGNDPSELSNKLATVLEG